MTNLPARLSFLAVRCLKNYGSYVVEQRVIPDYRDGLKPVQRRILWALYKAGALSNRAFKKKANIVGDAMKYHPHGDAPISDAMTSMVHDRYPLIEGYGSWGDPLFGQPAGAMRYIECRLSRLGEAFFERLSVTPMVPNYSGEYEEPLILHHPLPLYLLNGGSGIAVGVAFNVPPHHAGEVFRTIRYLIERPNATVRELVEKGILNGPDYKAGGVLVSSKEEVIRMYETGQGSLTYRCRYELDPENNLLIIKSAAPGIRLDSLLEKLKDLVEKGLLGFVHDESGGDQIRIVVEYTDVNVLKSQVLPLLRSTVHYSWSYTERLNAEKSTFGTTNLLDYLHRWLDYRRRVEEQYLRYQLAKAEREAREVEIVLLVTRDLDRLFRAVRAKDPVKALRQAFALTDEEAKFILSRSLQSFTRASQTKLKERLKALKSRQHTLRQRLKNIDDEILKTLEKFADLAKEPRLTLIREAEPELPKPTVNSYLCLRLDNLKVWSETKPGRAKTDALILAGYPFLVVTKEGRGRLLQYPAGMKYLEEYRRRVVVALPLLPDHYVALLDDNHRLLVFPVEALQSSSARERQVFNTKGQVIAGTLLSKELIPVLIGSRSLKVMDDWEDIVLKPGQAGRAVARGVLGLGVCLEEIDGSFIVEGPAIVLLANGQRKAVTSTAQFAEPPKLILKKA